MWNDVSVVMISESISNGFDNFLQLGLKLTPIPNSVRVQWKSTKNHSFSSGSLPRKMIKCKKCH